MVDTPPTTPSRVFPLPGYTGSIAPHGAPENVGGSDIFAPKGTPVLSMVSGKVSFVSTQATAPNSGGNAVEITGTDGLEYYYAHLLNATGLSVGQTVQAGQQLGQVDNTGNAATTASHLHIGIGKSIVSGTGPYAGISHDTTNAVDMLRALELDPRANNPNLVNAGANGNPPLNPPNISFVPSIPGFDSAHLSDIELNAKMAIQNGIDPFVWLAIVAHESNFVDGVMNQQGSGACGYAQLDPCPSGAQYGEANIQAGIDKFKTFLQQCNGDLTCALDTHYSGGIPGYAALINNWAKQIENANPGLPGMDFGQVAAGTFNANPAGGAATSAVDYSSGCSKWDIGPVSIPDLGCVISNVIRGWVKSLQDWWSAWQTKHIPSWTFVLLGLVVVLVGLNMVASDTGVASQAAKIVGPELLAA